MIQRHIFIDIVGQEQLLLLLMELLMMLLMLMGTVRRLAYVERIERIGRIGGEHGRRECGRQYAIITDDHRCADRAVHMVHAIGCDGDITQCLTGRPFAQILNGSGLQEEWERERKGNVCLISSWQKLDMQKHVLSLDGTLIGLKAVLSRISFLFFTTPPTRKPRICWKMSRAFASCVCANVCQFSCFPLSCSPLIRFLF